MNKLKSAMVGLNKGLPTVYNKPGVALLIICLVTTGCALIKLKKENAQGLASTALVGRISTAFPGNGPIVVAAYAMNQGKKEVVDYTVLHDFGEYEVLVAKGNYYVFAYWDKNSNLIYDAGEPAGQYGDPKMVFAPAGGVVAEINISIPEKAQNIDVPSGFEISAVKPHKLYSRLAGAIVDLDDELFSEENGSKGYWEGFTFFKEIGGNIYFLEEYDPQKIPILFIHGVTGTPKGWKYFVDNIDRTRFQPWFFYYASGSPIKTSSHLLYWKLENLKLKYNFEQLYITAHSLGGLVARSFIMDHSARFPYVKLFISLATPWGGDRMAEYGVKQSPAVVPCWIDMQPESPFIQSLYRTKMPDTVSFYMFYGHRGSRNPFRSNNDRAIAFSSLLDRRAQSEAKMNYAFNVDHASIIYSKAVSDQYNAIINTFSHPSGGYLKIHFSYHHSFDGERPEPTLILQLIGKKHAEMEIKLRADDNGRILGPFPAGDYLTTFGAFTAIGKGNVSVTIENQETCELKYVLTPDNVIYGTLISALQSKDWAAGMPYQENFTIQSITLNGTGIHRKSHLLEGDDVNILDYFIPRADCYHKGNFFFFGLPAGEFELVIRAQGYKPFVKKCFVKSGKQLDPMHVELTPE
ncbi:alpha/beta hydrolase [Desulfobacterales bacterium HSG16]|nr:alpha/beta hydrolase [Desulfobacterales bacterium HSG16]